MGYALTSPSQGLQSMSGSWLKGLAVSFRERVKKALKDRYAPPAGVSQPLREMPEDRTKGLIKKVDKGESRKYPPILDMQGWTRGLRVRRPGRLL